MNTHPHTLGNLATEMGRVRHAEASYERQLAQARTSAQGGTGGLRVARGPLATVLVVLAAALTLVTTAAAPQENKTAKVNTANYFVQHPGSLGGQTDLDPFDPYAPLDTGTVLISVGFTSVEGFGEAWAPPPPLGRPGQPS